MLRYSLNLRKNKSVKVYGRSLRISGKNAMVVCHEISGKSLPKAKALLQGLVDKKRNLGGKYYTNASSEIRDLLDSAERNAEFKGLDAERMIVNASVHQGFRFMRPRRFKMRRQQRKIASVQLVLQEK